MAGISLHTTYKTDEVYSTVTRSAWKKDFEDLDYISITQGTKQAVPVKAGAPSRWIARRAHPTRASVASAAQGGTATTGSRRLLY